MIMKAARIFFLVAIFLALVASVQAQGALGVESTVIQSIQLPAEPMDVAGSEDGQWFFVLTPKEVLVYKPGGREPLSRIKVEGGFERILYSGMHQALILTSQSRKAMEVLRVEFIYDIPVQDHPFKGRRDAPITIVVFDDYQCPYCAKLEPQLTQVLQRYPDQVKLVIKQFPLNSHPQALPAAKAALAAHRQGRFWEFHKELFEKQRELSEDKFIEIAKSLNLDINKFQADLKDPSIVEMINRDLQNGYQLQVRGTPTVFVNGKLVRRPDLPGIVEFVEGELKKGK